MIVLILSFWCRRCGQSRVAIAYRRSSCQRQWCVITLHAQQLTALTIVNCSYERGPDPGYGGSYGGGYGR